jgi:hypothetical protein
MKYENIISFEKELLETGIFTSEILYAEKSYSVLVINGTEIRLNLFIDGCEFDCNGNEVKFGDNIAFEKILDHEDLSDEIRQKIIFNFDIFLNIDKRYKDIITNKVENND